MRIYAPVKDANGVWCSVLFTNGVGETSNPYLINYFKEHGYKVEESEKVEVKPKSQFESVLDKVLEDAEPNFEAMTPNELREWMKANGYGSKIKNIRDKDKLIDIIRG